MQEQNTLGSPPTLFLGETVGPTLELPLEPAGALQGAGSTWVAILLFGLIGFTASAFLIPLSQGHLALPWSEELRSSIPGLWESDPAGNERVAQAPTEPTEDASPPSMAEVALQLEKLNGKYCFNYMPSGDDPKARDAFSKLYWSKLNTELAQVTQDRLDVCFPFAYRTPDVLVGGGCQKSNCGVNDVSFYIQRSGKIAMDYRVDGECRHASEEGFAHTSLLCSD